MAKPQVIKLGFFVPQELRSRKLSEKMLMAYLSEEKKLTEEYC